MTQPNTNQNQKPAAQNTSAPANQNASAATSQSESTIWQWKNTAHITKNTMEVGFAVAAVAIAGTAIYAAAAGMALPLAFIAQPWVIAAIASYVAVYFIARSISSWQQTYAMEGAKGEKGDPGQVTKGDQGIPGERADFADLVKDAVKSGEIVEETVKDANNTDIKQLSLKLSATDYAAFTQGKNADDEITLNVLSAGKSVGVKFKHVAAANDNGNYKVVLTSPTDKKELGMDNVASLKVAVSDKDLDALKKGVATELSGVAVNAAISKAASK